MAQPNAGLVRRHHCAEIANVRIVKEDPSDNQPMAAFDIGSNSIKMTVGRSNGAGGVDEFVWRSETVRLGAGIEETGRLAALRQFAREARDAGATRLIGVATEATRVAENGEAFLACVRDETGLELK